MKKKEKQQWLDALTIAAFVMQAAELGMALWEKRKKGSNSRPQSVKNEA